MSKVDSSPRVSAFTFSAAIAAALVVLPATAGAQNARPAQDTQVTFAKHVAPILQRSCQTCHRAGELAPMSLMTYEEVRPWARAIKSRVVAREMPPWHIDRTIGIQQFKDDPSLTDDEIDTIAKWVDSGAPRGNPADLPPARQFADSSQWQIRKAGPHREVPGLQGPRYGPRPLRRSLHRDRHRRGSLHQGHPDAAGHSGLAQGRAPCALLRRRSF